MHTDDPAERLLRAVDRIDPRLGNTVRQKFEADYTAFSKEAEEATPSQDPAYWAKPSCRHCHGRGTMGTLRTSTKPDAPASKLLCECAAKGYQKWLASFRREYNARRKQAAVEGSTHETAPETQTQTLSGAAGTEEGESP
jgi:hypothetical protein